MLAGIRPSAGEGSCADDHDAKCRLRGGMSQGGWDRHSQARLVAEDTVYSVEGAVGDGSSVPTAPYASCC